MRWQPTREEWFKRNRRLIPWNVITMLVAIAVAVLLFFGSFFRITIVVPLSGLSEIGDIFGESETSQNYDQYGDENGEGGFMDFLRDFDFSVLEGEELSVSIAITNRSLIRGVFGNPVQSVLEDTIDDLVDQIPPIFGLLVNSMARGILTDSINYVIEGDDVPDVMANLNASEISLTAQRIIGGDYTAEQATVALRNIAYNALNATETLSVEERESIFYDFNNTLETFIEEFFYGANEQGHIDLRIMFADMIIDMLSEGYYAPDFNFDGDNFAYALAEFLVNQMGDAVSLLNIPIITMMALLLLTIFFWALLALMAFIRLFTKRRILYLGNVRGFGWFLFLFLVLIPVIVWAIISRVNINDIGTLRDMGGSVNFMSMTIASFIGTWVVTFISAFSRRARLRKAWRRRRQNPNWNNGNDGNNNWHHNNHNGNATTVTTTTTWSNNGNNNNRNWD